MITRKDIAQKAGVSVSVVSRALNNSGYVEGNKRKLILEIADTLNYRPNPVAMSLQKQRTKQILFYSKDLNNAFNIEMYEGMIEEAEKNGYIVVINGKINFDRVRNLMIDGIILPNQQVTAEYLETVGKHYYLPVVAAAYGDNVFFSKAVPIVECNFLQETKNALQYLRKRGHRKIAMVIPYDFNTNNTRAMAWKEFMEEELGDRLKDYFLGISKSGLNNDKRTLQFLEEQNEDPMHIPESFFEKGMLAAEILVERKLNATAVLCFNDEMALGFAKRIKQLGYKVPDDLSIMGIDGVSTRKYMEPELTTLSLQPKVMGAKCVKVLLSILMEKKVKYVTHIPTKIIEGESVRSL
jgi:DNA-binding LacI/PurR family transcriptional regulator